MNDMSVAVPEPVSGSYVATRWNAVQHGVLSRHVVLPWEDASEYRVLLEALVAEHAPEGPTEGHLVEELAGIIWRKRRLRQAEAAIYREELRQDATSHGDPERISGAALMPITGNTGHKANLARSLSATPSTTGRDLRDLKRDQAMTRKAWDILAADDANAYANALAALREDTRAAWDDALTESPARKETAAALRDWINHHWREWYDQPIAELEHRDAIRDQAVGVAYATPRLEAPARYEVHLDRKLERTLSMLIRLREMRKANVPA